MSRLAAWLITFGICAIVISFQYEKIKELKVENGFLNAELTELQVQSEADTQRYKDAQDEADSQLMQSQDQVKKVLAAKVSTTCAEAVRWAVDEAKDFNA